MAYIYIAKGACVFSYTLPFIGDGGRNFFVRFELHPTLAPTLPNQPMKTMQG